MKTQDNISVNFEPLNNIQLREKLKKDLAEIQDFMLDFMNHPDLDMSYKIFLSKPDKSEHGGYTTSVLNYLDNMDLMQYLRIFIKGTFIQLGKEQTSLILMKILRDLSKEFEDD